MKMNNIVIRKSSGWERDYGKYMVIDNMNLTAESVDSIPSMMRLLISKLKFIKNIERCCR